MLDCAPFFLSGLKSKKFSAILVGPAPKGLQWLVLRGLQWLGPPATYAHWVDECASIHGCFVVAIKFDSQHVMSLLQ